eukprot:m.27358 g.27358  ORF g.27358 m.27358 type:complete len:272 (+) comp8527_c0_seq1:128-943(+)
MEDEASVSVAASEASAALRRELLLLPGNASCADCGASDEPPDWASINCGTLFCLGCSGKHRALGVQKSFVRSVTLDMWTEAQRQALRKAGGNDAVNDFLARHGHSGSRHNSQQGAPPAGGQQQQQGKPTSSSSSSSIVRAKYTSAAAELWRRHLKALVEGTDPPTALGPEDLKQIDEENAAWRLQEQNESRRREKAAWTPDHQAPLCEMCNTKFSVVKRRHHCRRCGRCVCASCAPRDNARPILEWGITAVVRHCKDCYKAPVANQRVGNL